MTDWPATISSLSQLVTAIGVIYGIYVSRGNRKVLTVVKQVVDDVAVKTDGLTTRLVESARELGDAKGEVARHEGGDAERAKQDRLAEKDGDAAKVEVVNKDPLLVTQIPATKTKS